MWTVSWEAAPPGEEKGRGHAEQAQGARRGPRQVHRRCSINAFSETVPAQHRTFYSRTHSGSGGHVRGRASGRVMDLIEVNASCTVP